MEEAKSFDTQLSHVSHGDWIYLHVSVFSGGLPMAKASSNKYTLRNVQEFVFDL
jgi:hypothetical protein